jgi:hypothetical protein
LYIRDETFLSKIVPVPNQIEMEKAWEALWERLAECNSLQNLHVRILDRGFRLPENEFLQPLRHLKVPNFTVQLPWPRDYLPQYALESDEEPGFVLKRPPEGSVLHFSYRYMELALKGWPSCTRKFDPELLR